MHKTALILGGYGNAGLLVARLLLQESEVQLILAGRNSSRASLAADRLNRKYGANRVSTKEADAADAKSLEVALEGVDIVVVASSTIDYTRNVADAAINAGADYLDVQLSSPAKLAALNSLRKRIEENGRCFITDGGFHPGVPAAMVRYAAMEFDELQIANVSSAFQLNWKELDFSESTHSEFVDELNNLNALALKEKKWVKIGMKNLPKFDFGALFGERYCAPMFLEELRSLPNAIPSLNETGFYVAGFNWMTDYVIMPIAFAALKIFPEKAKKPMGRLLFWSLRSFSRPPFGAVLQLEAKGVKDEQTSCMRMRLTQDDAYVLTAVPVAACLLQYFEGEIRCPGLWCQANWVEPKRFFDDIERLGVCISRHNVIGSSCV